MSPLLLQEDSQAPKRLRRERGKRAGGKRDVQVILLFPFLLFPPLLTALSPAHLMQEWEGAAPILP